MLSGSGTSVKAEKLCRLETKDEVGLGLYLCHTRLLLNSLSQSHSKFGIAVYAGNESPQELVFEGEDDPLVEKVPVYGTVASQDLVHVARKICTVLAKLILVPCEQRKDGTKKGSLVRARDCVETCLALPGQCGCI